MSGASGSPCSAVRSLWSLVVPATVRAWGQGNGGMACTGSCELRTCVCCRWTGRGGSLPLQEDPQPGLPFHKAFP